MGDLLLRDLGQLRRRLAPHLTRARKVIVFGSVARGDADAGSDLDLIIVADTARPFFERFKDFAGLYDVWPRLDLLIYIDRADPVEGQDAWPASKPPGDSERIAMGARGQGNDDAGAKVSVQLVR